MDLQYFPMDSQLCYIEIESCKFTLNACPPQPDSVCFQLVIRWVIFVTSGTTGSTPYRCLGMCRCHSLRWFTAHDTACLKFLKTRTFINLPVQNFGTNAKFDNLTTKHCLNFLCGNTWCISLVIQRKQKSKKDYEMTLDCTQNNPGQITHFNWSVKGLWISKILPSLSRIGELLFFGQVEVQVLIESNQESRSRLPTGIEMNGSLLSFRFT